MAVTATPMRKASALRLESALVTFLFENRDIWPEDDETIRAALEVARRYQR